MSIETPSVAPNIEIWRGNINTLIQIFQLNHRAGRFEENDDIIVNKIEAKIQRHSVSSDGGYNQIGDPITFTEDLITSRDTMIADTEDVGRKEKIKVLFAKVGSELAAE